MPGLFVVFCWLVCCVFVCVFLLLLLLFLGGAEGGNIYIFF